MSFLDSLKETAKNLGDKAMDTAEIGKLKLKISSAESDIKGIYAEIGKKLFAEHSDVAARLFGEQKSKIDGLLAEIEEFNNKIELVKTTTGKVAETVKEAAKSAEAKVEEVVQNVEAKAEEVAKKAEAEAEGEGKCCEAKAEGGAAEACCRCEKPAGE